jgi:hypothetical protein
VTIDEILREGRATWGDKPMTLEHIVAAIGVVYGDICRQARSKIEQGTYSEAELQKELGNLMSSVVRWCDDLGFDPEACIQLSQTAQKKYIAR